MAKAKRKAKRSLLTVSAAIRPEFTVTRFYMVPMDTTEHECAMYAADHAKRCKVEEGTVTAVLGKPKAVRSSCHVGKQTPSDAWLEGQAVAYAKWLAARDGIALPADCTSVRAEFSHVNVLNSKGRLVMKRRCKAVHWRKDDRRQGKYDVLLTIKIPNWDHVPTVTEETLDSPALVPETVRELEAA